MRNADNKTQETLFIERLTIFSWLFTIVPYLFRGLIRRPLKVCKVYFIDASCPGLLVAKLGLLFSSTKPEKLNYRLIDIRDEKGVLVRERIVYFDLFEILKKILSGVSFRKILSENKSKNRIPTFLSKQVTSYSTYLNSSVWCAQFLVQVVHWKVKKDASLAAARSVLFLDKRPWFGQIKEYAYSYGVNAVETINLRFSLKSFVITLAGDKLKSLQGKYFYIKRKGILNFLKYLFFGKHSLSGRLAKQDTAKGNVSGAGNPKLVVQYYGHLNLGNPQLHSDLFFWQQSKFSAEDILIMFNVARDKLDREKWQEIKKYGMNAVALSPRDTVIPEAEVFCHWPSKAVSDFFPSPVEFSKKTVEERWLRRQLSYYHMQYNYWFDFFSRYNVKLYLTWFRYNGLHCVMADALGALGGVTAIYQRAFEEFPAATSTIDADINFGFSYNNAEIERQGGSNIS
ncbi:MAG: hypothetical protein PHE97_07345, partial [Candidatus Omnitrophica bacterium]|nr:hypothetical protein [Candidatus Omnitrophota bacterium]